MIFLQKVLKLLKKNHKTAFKNVIINIVVEGALNKMKK